MRPRGRSSTATARPAPAGGCGAGFPLAPRQRGRWESLGRRCRRRRRPARATTSASRQAISGWTGTRGRATRTQRPVVGQVDQRRGDPSGVHRAAGRPADDDVLGAVVAQAATASSSTRRSPREATTTSRRPRPLRTGAGGRLLQGAREGVLGGESRSMRGEPAPRRSSGVDPGGRHRRRYRRRPRRGDGRRRGSARSGVGGRGVTLVKRPAPPGEQAGWGAELHKRCAGSDRGWLTSRGARR